MIYNCKMSARFNVKYFCEIFLLDVGRCTLHRVRLPRMIRRLLGQQSSRKVQRHTTISKIEAMGFKVEDLSGWHEGKFASRRYRLIDSDGKVLDNDGAGFASSSEAYRAAQSATENLG